MIEKSGATHWLPDYEPYLDEIFELIGVERPARQYEREEKLCCAGPAIFVNKELGTEIQNKNLQDAVDVGAEAMIHCCPMCYKSLTRATAEFGVKNMYITELVSIALGERPWPA